MTDSSDTYQTIGQSGEGLLRDRGSKFLAFAYGVEDEQQITARLDEVRRAHPKSRHHCYAYRLGTDGNRYRANDDGEPSGTAGRPILGQIDSFGVTDTLVVVVRYFGGTLLGTSGLIQAYRGSAQEALTNAQIVTRVVQEAFTLRFDYTHTTPVMNTISQMNIEMVEQRYGEYSEIDIRLPRSEAVDTLRYLKARVADVYLEEVDANFVVAGLSILPANI